MQFTVYDKATGKILRSGFSATPEIQANNDSEGVVIGVSEPFGYVQNGEVIKIVAPSEFHQFDYVTKTWVLNLSEAKAQAKDRITKSRNAEEANGFTAYGNVFDSDTTAVQRISVAVQAANAVGETFTVVWTCKDNTTITLDYAQTLALPAFMADVANTLHIKARKLKDQIDSASSLEEINLIVW